MGDLAIVIPAFNEADRIGGTVTAAAQLPGADIVVVVDDGSRDGTAAAAEAAGASVVRHSRNRGKAAAMETGAEAVRLIESRTAAGEDHSEPRAADGPGRDHSESRVATGPGPDRTESRAAAGPEQDRAEPRAADGPGPIRTEPRYLLFLDADLAESAAQAGPLAEPVRAGTADMTIAAFSNRVRMGGHGFVMALAGGGIERATGWRPAQPLNGQRCLTRAAFEAALPLAAGFGVETGLTIDLLRRGLRIIEVEVPLSHRATGRDLRSQLHRARQFIDVARALAARRVLRPTRR